MQFDWFWSVIGGKYLLNYLSQRLPKLHILLVLCLGGATLWWIDRVIQITAAGMTFEFAAMTALLTGMIGVFFFDLHDIRYRSRGQTRWFYLGIGWYTFWLVTVSYAFTNFGPVEVIAVTRATCVLTIGILFKVLLETMAAGFCYQNPLSSETRMIQFKP